MASVKVKNNVPEFAKQAQANIALAMAQGVLLGAEHITGEIRREVFRSSPKGRGGLAASYKAGMVSSDRFTATAKASSKLVYAKIQDEGGTIHAKTGKALAVPLSEKARRTVGLWPRHWPKGKLQFIKTKGGKAFLIEKTGRDSSIFHYVLKKQVTIKPKHYLKKALAESRAELKEIMGGKYSVAVSNAAARVK